MMCYILIQNSTMFTPLDDQEQAVCGILISQYKQKQTKVRDRERDRENIYREETENVQAWYCCVKPASCV
ncbi:hypothetical protein PILCRDRAFT_739854 [Piloderma croceum F 1598]|uniref:Uncharacterized protein n=1 Tax=Piloderma croceum (strain F 1598) TaxID=765440 RepID=A0A0C3EWZ9_PILCF|nr:hypothetical protein PILCRDRAFT_739854 [Piloderma croceum F 1598]